MKTRDWIHAGLMFLTFATGTASAQVNGGAADALRAADEAYLKVYAARDVDRSVAFFDADGSILAPNAPIATGKSAIAKSLSDDFAAGIASWHADAVGVAKSGDLAYTSGRYEFFKDSSSKSPIDNGKYLTLWRRQKDGSWKVLFDAFNTDRPEPK